jgi:ubiquinone/menaquinone biosynthesis C-methylase UbiE
MLNHIGVLSERDIYNLSGHWVLARMGKKVLRPGGRKLTEKMVHALHITSDDDVIEFAPGLGFTANLVLRHNPHSYIGVEPDDTAAQEARTVLSSYPRNNYKIMVGNAENTDLPDASASIVYGEAMLTMQAEHHKVNILREGLRFLKPGGRYGIHELCLTPDDISPQLKTQIQKELAQVIKVNARPLTISEWHSIFVEQGFRVQDAFTAPMHLLKIGRIIEDEGIRRTLRIVFNILYHPTARKRILAMQSVFNKYADHLGAIALIAVKN